MSNVTQSILFCHFFQLIQWILGKLYYLFQIANIRLLDQPHNFGNYHGICLRKTYAISPNNSLWNRKRWVKSLPFFYFRILEVLAEFVFEVVEMFFKVEWWAVENIQEVFVWAVRLHRSLDQDGPCDICRVIPVRLLRKVSFIKVQDLVIGLDHDFEMWAA